MAKSKLFKKKKSEAPKELPDLAIDELKKDLNQAVAPKPDQGNASPETAPSEPPEPQGETPRQDSDKNTPNEPKPEQQQNQNQETQEEVVEEVVEEAPAEGSNKEDAKTQEQAPEQQQNQNQETQEEVVEEVVEEEVPTVERAPSNLDPDKSYFNGIMKEFDHEKVDIEKINQWYKENFPKGDALGEMKEYWEEKKDELILQSIGKDYKEKIASNMKNLQKLEGEWQKIYFDLITKEEEMKNQEKKLREIIKEFTEIVKKRKKQDKEEKSEKKTSKKRKS